jgi:hypothetical protein
VGEFRTQKRAIGLGVVLGVLLTATVVGTLLLVAGKDTRTETRARPATRGRAIYTLRWGDVVRDPRTGTRCEATGEGGIPNLFCTHTVRGRYEAVFWDDELQVYGPGSEAMTPTYSFNWWGRVRR